MTVDQTINVEISGEDNPNPPPPSSDKNNNLLKAAAVIGVTVTAIGVGYVVTKKEK